MLDFAGAHPHMIRVDIDSTNSWGPAGYFWALPQQLWPYLLRSILVLLSRLINFVFA